MEFLMEHWLSIGVGVFLLSMVLYGHYRGFLRLAVTMTALILSLIVVRVAMPYVTGALKENTGIHRAIGQGLLHMAGIEDIEEMIEAPQLPVQQREAIERLKLPEQMKEALLENNNNEIYHILGVDAFLDYLGAYLASMVLNLIGSVLLFLIVFLAIRLLIKWLDLVAKLPILSGINQIAGAILGGCQGLLVLWIAALIVKACAAMPWAQMVLVQVEGSLWLSFLYHNNIFNWLFISVLNSIV